MTIRVCHITSAHNSNDNRILKKECVSLAKRDDFKVFLLARGENYTYKNVNIVGIGYKECSRIDRITKVIHKLYIEAININADIYHIHDPELLFLVKKLKKRGKKIIFDSHELYSKQIETKDYLPKFSIKIIAKIYIIFEKKACKNLDAVIFPCPVNGEHPFKGKIDRCEFINNYPIIENIKKIDNSKNNDEKNEFVVCCIGSLTPERGIENLVKACCEAKVKLILGGNITPPEFREKIINKDAYKATVDYKGVCNRDQVLEIYKRSDMGASTILDVGQYSIIENFPTKVYEFMMEGLPFIISDFYYSRKLLNELKCGICVDSSDINEIKQAILYLKNNRDISKQMGQNGRKSIEKYFNWDIEEKKLYVLYNELLKEK